MKQVLNSAENKKKKWAKPGSFCLFSFFSHEKYSSNTINEKSVDGVLGTRTRASNGRRRRIHWAMEAPIKRSYFVILKNTFWHLWLHLPITFTYGAKEWSKTLHIPTLFIVSKWLIYQSSLSLKLCTIIHFVSQIIG